MSKHHRKRHHTIRRRTPPGAAPGVLAADPQAQPSSLTVTAFGPEKVEHASDAEPRSLVKRRGAQPVLWIDVAGLGDVDVIRALGEAFGLHRLALEDVVNVHQQVKVEDYGDHLFVVARTAERGESASEQLSIFLGSDFVITFQERPGDELRPIRERLDEAHSLLRQHGADFLAYAVLDAITDGYFPRAEQFGLALDELEDALSDCPPRDLVQVINHHRAELRNDRRVVWQMREAVGALLRDPNPLIGDAARTYLRDCHDHTMQLVDLLEIYRETCADLRDVYLSAVSNRMNEIMMVLTVIATIFIPLSFIASLYGMNFNPQVSPWNMPELNWFFGYPFALGLMAAVAAGLLVFFRRRGWM